MSLQYIINLGNTIIERCSDLINFLNMSIADLWKFNSIVNPFNAVIRDLLLSTTFGSTTLLDILFFGSLGGFIVYTIIKWALPLA